MAQRYEELKRIYEDLRSQGVDLRPLDQLVHDVEQARRARDVRHLDRLLDQVETSLQSIGSLDRAQAQTGSSPPTSAVSEARFLADISADFLALLRARARRVEIAGNGAVGRNIGSFSDVAAQRDALWVLLLGVASRDPNLVDDAVRAMEYAFTMQSPAGHFYNGHGASARKAVGVDAFFLQAFARVVMIVRESAFHDQFSPRLDALLADAHRALRWLGTETEELHRQDRRATNRLLFDAMAFRLGSELMHEDDLGRIGDDFIRAALANLRADGSFNEHGGYDTSYQMTSVGNLAVLSLVLPPGHRRSEVVQAIDRAVRWQLPRVDPHGEVSVQGNARTGLGQETLFGVEKDVNYPEVAMAFLYASRVLADPRLAAVGETVIDHVLRQAGYR